MKPDGLLAGASARRRARGVPPSRRGSRREPGFSLLELTVSLALAAVAVTAAAALLSGLGSRAQAIRSAAVAADRAGNAERLLRLLAANADPGQAQPGLEGDAQSVTFGTWCEEPRGWLEPCRVRLLFRHGGSSVLLAMKRLPAARPDRIDESGAAELVLLDGLRSGSFLYLVDAAAGGRWARSWTAVAVPAAIAAVIEGDTLILPLR